MAKQITLDFSSTKTYVSTKSLERAVAAADGWLGENARYIVMTTPEGRFTPVFMFKGLPEGTGAMWVAQNGWHVVN